jgi:hypothetical protein
VVEVREDDGDAAGAVGAHGGLRADEGLHAVERGGRLPAHEVAPHQRLQLHQGLERAQRLLRLRDFFHSERNSGVKQSKAYERGGSTTARADALLDSIGRVL